MALNKRSEVVDIMKKRDGVKVVGTGNRKEMVKPTAPQFMRQRRTGRFQVDGNK